MSTMSEAVQFLAAQAKRADEERRELALAERLMAQGVPLDTLTQWWLLELAKRAVRP